MQRRALIIGMATLAPLAASACMSTCNDCTVTGFEVSENVSGWRSAPCTLTLAGNGRSVSFECASATVDLVPGDGGDANDASCAEYVRYPINGNDVECISDASGVLPVYRNLDCIHGWTSDLASFQALFGESPQIGISCGGHAVSSVPGTVICTKGL